MITTQERAKLRSLSSNLRDLVYLGKEGLTENVIAQINDNLYAHELIKIKAQRNIPEPITKMARDICDACKCILVGVIGNKIIVYKPTEKPHFAHLLDNYKYYY
jgi:RNA-binding protein